jgi:hypothetical protein
MVTYQGRLKKKKIHSSAQGTALKSNIKAFTSYDVNGKQHRLANSYLKDRKHICTLKMRAEIKIPFTTRLSVLLSSATKSHSLQLT